MTGVWRINLLPSGRSVDARRFCLENDIVGVGWPVKDLPSGATWEEYSSRADQLYRQRLNRKGWWPALRALHNRMRVGNLVWTRDETGTYLLGRVEGPWSYVLDARHEAADIVNVRKCPWTKIGAADEVPGPVTTSFRGLTLTEVKEPSASLTKLIYNDKVGSRAYQVELGEADLFGLLSADECEDLVALYLQVELGYCVLPSTAKPSTPAYEFVLRHRESGTKALVQVKSGSESLLVDRYHKAPADIVFLFSARGKYVNRVDESKVKCIEPEEVRHFFFENPALIPERTRRWLEALRGVAP